jgi:ankyrin repeat protein
VNFKYENCETILHLAASEGHWDIVALLVDKGANVKAKETIFGYTPLHHTSKYSNPQTKNEIITLLIENGADVNAKAKNGETPMDLLNDALDPPGFESLRTNTKNLLRKHGARTGEEIKAAMSEPTTAKAPDISIHKAVLSGNIEVVKQHLAAGTDVNAKGVSGPLQGMTPLAIAGMFSNKEIADLLRTHGGKTGEELKTEGK